MRKFKYQIFDLDLIPLPEGIFLNEMGANGWELIAVNNEPIKCGHMLNIKLYFRKEV